MSGRASGTVSRRAARLRVAFLGPLGTHSHEAAVRRYGAGLHLLPCRGFAEAFERLSASDPVERAEVAVVPMENSIEGPITQTLDLLAAHEDVTVRESFCMAIRQHLLAPRGLPLDRIRRVYSHPQGLAQCRGWLARRLPAADLAAVASTAEAARLAAADRVGAAVASRLAGRMHGLALRVPDIQDDTGNTTRFLAVTARGAAYRPPVRRPRPAGDRRALLFLTLPDRPGALLHALIPFEAGRLNLTFIQSRPLRGRAWEYGFFLEVQRRRRDAFASTQATLRAVVDSCRVLGEYSCGLRGLPE